MWRLKCIFRCENLLRSAVVLLLSRDSAQKQHNFRLFSVLTHTHTHTHTHINENEFPKGTRRSGTLYKAAHCAALFRHSVTQSSTIQAQCHTRNWQQTFSKIKLPLLPINTHTVQKSLLTAPYSKCCDVCLLCVNTVNTVNTSCRPLPYCLTCSSHIIHTQNRYHTITTFFRTLRHPNAKSSPPIVSCLHVPFPFPFPFLLTITQHIRRTTQLSLSSCC